MTVLEMGADDFLRKPFREEQIWEVLERLLGLEFDREAPEDVEVVAEEAELTREAVSMLGPQRISRLREAAEEADLDRAADELDQAEADHPDLVASLRALLDVYDYNQILDLL